MSKKSLLASFHSRSHANDLEMRHSFSSDRVTSSGLIHICSRLFRGSCCSSRVRTQAPPGGTLRRCRRCCHRQRHRRCRRRAYPELQRRRSPAAAGGAILGACGTARGSAGPRSRHPTASPCPGPARTGARSVLLARLSQLRRAGDPPSLQDGRGFPPSGRFEGRELPSWSDRDGGRGSPWRNDKVGGDSPRKRYTAGRASLWVNQES